MNAWWTIHVGCASPLNIEQTLLKLLSDAKALPCHRTNECTVGLRGQHRKKEREIYWHRNEESIQHIIIIKFIMSPWRLLVDGVCEGDPPVSAYNSACTVYVDEFLPFSVHLQSAYMAETVQLASLRSDRRWIREWLEVNSNSHSHVSACHL